MMKSIHASGLAVCLFASAIALVWAADDSGTVSVRGVHLCCGGCSTAAKEALDGIDGVSAVKADVNSKSVTYAAKDEKAALKGIEALAENGFCGKAAFGKKDLAFPEIKVKKGEKRDIITFSQVHLCCAACKTAVTEAVTKLDGLASFEIDASAGSVKLNGAGLIVTDAVDLLQKAGFYGTLEKPEKK